MDRCKEDEVKKELMESNIFKNRKGEEKTMEEKIQFIYEKMKKEEMKDQNNEGFDEFKQENKEKDHK